MSKIRLATVLNPETNCLHIDDPYEAEPQYGTIVMDLNAYMSGLGSDSKAASAHAQNSASLDQIFYNTKDEEYGINALDDSGEYYDKILSSRAASTPNDRLEKGKALMGDKRFRNFQSLLAIADSLVYAQRHSRSGAIITSMDFTGFQDTPTLGGNVETNIRTGVLAGLFQTVAMPVLSGKWISAFANDLKYYRNLMETESPIPSKGTGATTTVNIQKHGGAVAITQRAQMVINNDNPFQRLVTQMGQKKLFDENDMIADEIEGNTANTYAGVDFGLRAGTPPLSSTNPVDFLATTISTFEALSQNINLFISRGLAFTEYTFNDIVRGGALAGNPLPAQGNINEQVGPFPGLGGVTWARDNAITSLTAGWAMNDNAIKLFRGPSRNYTIADEDIETTKYVTKNYFKPSTVDASLIYKVTGITA
jgi:hypothetical protein